MCSGAHLALDIARQLTRAGRCVGFLGVINTWALYTVSKGVYLRRGLDLMHWYGRRLGQMLPHQRRPAPQSAKSTDDAAALPADSASAAGLRSPWIAEVGWVHKNPREPKYPGRVTVLRLAKNPQQYWRIRDDTLGWAALADEAVVCTLPGDDHDAITREPQVLHLAAAVEAGLALGESHA
jgi:thioesterase domain-containing protein